MTMKKQAPALHRKDQEKTTNRKAQIWVVSILAAIVILMTVLLIVNGS